MPQEESTPVASLFDKDQLDDVLTKATLLDRFARSGQSPEEFAKENDISATTLRRRLAAAREGSRNLIDKRKGRSGRKLKPIDERVFQFILTFIEQHKKAKLTSLHELLEEAAETKGWQRISYSTLCRLVNSLPDDFTTLISDGRKAHFDLKALVGRHGPYHPNACWQVDICELPIWVLDTTTMVLFKPFIIVYIDEATRVVVGWRLFRRERNRADLLLTLRMAIMGKHDASFPFCGKPDGIQSDNGGVFESEDYADCLLRMNIIRHEIPSESPSANGKVERFFRTIQDGLIRRLDGFSDQIGGLAAARESAIPWPVLPRLVSQYMAKYHSDVHSFLKMSPWVAWHDRLADAKGLGVVLADVVNATMFRMDAPVQRDGVHLDDGNTYSDACLTGYVDKTITVRVQPDKPYDYVEAYIEGRFLGVLQNIAHNPELADQIKAFRVQRTIDLQHLSKILSSMAPTVLPDPTIAPPGALAIPSGEIKVEAPPAEKPLAEIPVVQVEQSS
jgi:putative transposase